MLGRVFGAIMNKIAMLKWGRLDNKETILC
jgi:hypothetical protein